MKSKESQRELERERNKLRDMMGNGEVYKADKTLDGRWVFTHRLTGVQGVDKHAEKAFKKCIEQVKI